MNEIGAVRLVPMASWDEVAVEGEAVAAIINEIGAVRLVPIASWDEIAVEREAAAC